MMSTRERIFASDNALNAAFKTLPTELRFHNTIKSYFDDLNAKKHYELIEERANNVQKAITTLWEEAAKNADFLEDFRKFEPLLKELGLRDHFIHSFNVFLLGYFIINKFRIDRKSILGKHPLEGNDFTTNLIWMLTATFHDAAYAVGKTDEWLNDFFTKFLGVNPHISLNISEVLTPVHADILRLLSQYHRSRRLNSPEDPFKFKFDLMDWPFYNKLSEELSNKNHGVLSALMLCHRMAIKEGFLGKPIQTDNVPVSLPDRNQWDFVDHLQASHAISLHTINSIQVKFREYPFAFVLILCDEIQDWGRGNQNDFISLNQIEERVTNVHDRTVHEVRFRIEASPGRMNSLKKTLRERLDPGNTIKIFINDEDIFA